jgi:hypothetical protein
MSCLNGAVPRAAEDGAGRAVLDLQAPPNDVQRVDQGLAVTERKTRKMGYQEGNGKGKNANGLRNRESWVSMHDETRDGLQRRNKLAMEYKSKSVTARASASD